MSASVFLFDAPLSAGSTVHLDGPEGHHAATVMRLRVGEDVVLVDGRGTRAIGTVAVTRKDSIEVAVSSVATEPDLSPRLVVIQAVLKGDHGELAIDQLTQVGADLIVPWTSERSVVAVDRLEKIVTKLRQRSIAAGKQARMARFPAVADPVTTAEVVARVEAASVALVLHEESQHPINDIDISVELSARSGDGDIVLVIGPEGGLSPQERAVLIEAGGIEARLGPGVLRGSLAGAIAAGIVLARTRWGTVAGSSS